MKGGVSTNPSRQFFYKTRSYSRCEISSLRFVQFFNRTNIKIWFHLTTKLKLNLSDVTMLLVTLLWVDGFITEAVKRWTNLLICRNLCQFVYFLFSFDFFTESNRQRNFIDSIPQISSRIEPHTDNMQGNMYYVKSPDKNKQETNNSECFQVIWFLNNFFFN